MKDLAIEKKKTCLGRRRLQFNSKSNAWWIRGVSTVFKTAASCDITEASALDTQHVPLSLGVLSSLWYIPIMSYSPYKFFCFYRCIKISILETMTISSYCWQLSNQYIFRLYSFQCLIFKIVISQLSSTKKKKLFQGDWWDGAWLMTWVRSPGHTQQKEKLAPSSSLLASTQVWHLLAQKWNKIKVIQRILSWA